ncbi:MAG: Sec-independent protein translocase subunit TatC [Parcubacteria group bacterium Athens0714_24]|nr:MAG: Sec-independent protein translocase subunit TatC [Parcubacteria group bacterium Athens0714_24]
MNFFQELRKFIKNILSWIYILAILSFAFFIFPFRRPFSLMFFEKIKADLLPQEVQLIATNPMAAFLSQMIISIFLAFIVISPFIIYSAIRYLSPALYKKEKMALFKLIIPSSFLFIMGCIFSYFFLIPPTFKILYSFTSAMGVEQFFTVGEFVYSVLGLMMAVGIMFLLPIFMGILSWMNVIEKDFWSNNWRYAFLVFLIFSAIITPDGTGITMAILTLPLIGLYGLGTIISKK